MKLLALYQSILEDVGLIVDGDGAVLGENKKPIQLTVDGMKRPLVLPTAAQLKREDSSDIVFFHPACENLYRGRSEVLNALCMLMAQRIWQTGLFTVMGMLHFGADKDAHAKAKQREWDLLAKMEGVSKSTLAAWSSLMGTLTPPGEQGKRPLLHLSLMRQVEMDDGSKFKRACLITYPLVQSEDLYGHKFTGTALRTVKTVLETVFGDSDILEGSNGMVAPYFQSLCKSYHAAMTQIHTVAKHLKRYLTGKLAIRPFNGDWLETLPNIEKWYGEELNLSLDGNQGVGGEDDVPAASPKPAEAKPRIARHGSATPAPVQHAPTAPAPSPHQPARAPAARQQTDDAPGVGRGLGLPKRGGGPAKPYTPAPTPQPQPHMHQPMPQQAYYGAPVQPQYAQPQYAQPAQPHVDQWGRMIDPQSGMPLPPGQGYTLTYPQPTPPAFDPRRPGYGQMQPYGQPQYPQYQVDQYGRPIY